MSAGWGRDLRPEDSIFEALAVSKQGGSGAAAPRLRREGRGAGGREWRASPEPPVEVQKIFKTSLTGSWNFDFLYFVTVRTESRQASPGLRESRAVKCTVTTLAELSGWPVYFEVQAVRAAQHQEGSTTALRREQAPDACPAVFICAWCGVTLTHRRISPDFKGVSHGICLACRERFLSGIVRKEKLA